MLQIKKMRCDHVIDFAAALFAAGGRIFQKLLQTTWYFRQFMVYWHK